MQKANGSSLRVIGHRGAAGHAPENTLAAVRKALELGAQFIEVDVYALESELLVFHDQRLERTSNGSGYLLDSSFDQLRALDAGQGERIPTLPEVWHCLSEKAGINIEIKGPNTAVTLAAFIRRQLESGIDAAHFLVSSFDQRQLAAFKELCPEIHIAALLCGLPIDNAKIASDLGAFSLHLAKDFVDREIVQDAHQRGVRLYVYTVNHPEDIARMQDLGVDGVFSDYPERVLAQAGPGSAIDGPVTW